MSLLLTRTQNLRAQANLDQWTLRPSNYGAADFMIMDSNVPNSILSPGLKEKAFQSIGSTLQTPVFDEETVSISGSRSVTIADSENTSRMVDFTFVTYSWGFTIVPGVFHNNEFDMQADFNRKFLKYLYQFAIVVDTAAEAALDAAKTQVFSTILQPYANTGNVLTTALANEKRIISDVAPHMSANDFYGRIHLIGNPGFQSLVERLKFDGLYNAENKVIQLNDKVIHFSNRVTNAANFEATFYAVNEGSTGLLFRVEVEALLRSQALTGHRWDIDTLPLLNVPVGTYYYESVGDWNAIAGAATAHHTRGRKQHYGWSVDVCYVTPHNSDLTTYSSPIMKLAVADS